MYAIEEMRTIKSYQAEITDEESIARAVRLFPAILCVYGGSKYASHGSRRIEEMHFLLFAADKNLRTEEAGRRGGPANPGAYAILNGIRDLLYGKQLGLKIYPIELLQEDPVYLGSGISVYSAEYATSQALLYPIA
jgi:phage gp37-like protein